MDLNRYRILRVLGKYNEDCRPFPGFKNVATPKALGENLDKEEYDILCQETWPSCSFWNL